MNNASCNYKIAFFVALAVIVVLIIAAVVGPKGPTGPPEPSLGGANPKLHTWMVSWAGWAGAGAAKSRAMAAAALAIRTAGMVESPWTLSTREISKGSVRTYLEKNC